MHSACWFCHGLFLSGGNKPYWHSVGLPSSLVQPPETFVIMRILREHNKYLKCWTERINKAGQNRQLFDIFCAWRMAMSVFSSFRTQLYYRKRHISDKINIMALSICRFGVKFVTNATSILLLPRSEGGLWAGGPRRKVFSSTSSQIHSPWLEG